MHNFNCLFLFLCNHSSIQSFALHSAKARSPLICLGSQVENQWNRVFFTYLEEFQQCIRSYSRGSQKVCHSLWPSSRIQLCCSHWKDQRRTLARWGGMWEQWVCGVTSISHLKRRKASFQAFGRTVSLTGSRNCFEMDLWIKNSKKSPNLVGCNFYIFYNIYNPVHEVT